MFLNDILDMKWEFKGSPLDPFIYSDIPTDERLIRVNVDNLEQYNVDHPGNAEKISAKYGVCLAPWEWTWTEYRFRRSRLIGKVGILHHTMMVDNPQEYAKKRGANSDEDAIKLLQENPPRFYCLSNIFVYEKDMGAIRLIGEMWNMFDNDGRIMDVCSPSSTYLDLSIEANFRDCQQMFQKFLAPSFFAFSLSHCKNIELVTDSTDLSKPNIRRQNSNRSLLYQYKSVQLSDKTQKKYQRGDVATDENDSRSVRFHMCKGHFRTYTPDNPLFGRLAGKFWVPQHTKGTKDVGTVIKTYTANKSQ